MTSLRLVVTKGTPLALLLCALCLTSGCCTPGLWDHTAAKQWNPQPRTPSAWVTSDRQDVLVSFRQREVLGRKPRERLVACWLSTWPEIDVVGEKRLARLTQSMSPLPVIYARQLADLEAPETVNSMIWSRDNRELTIHLDNSVLDPQTLPRTCRKRRTVTRLIVFPPAVAVDAALAVGVVGAAACAGSYGNGELSMDDLISLVPSGNGNEGKRVARDY